MNKIEVGETGMMMAARRFLFLLTIAGALASVPVPVAAQAFTPPAGVGAVTLAWQYVDNTGHRLSDGSLTLPDGSPTGGTSVDMSFLVETEYGFTDRLAASLGLAYVFAKWTDPNPPPPFIPYLPVDSCHCWHSSFQDFSLAVRYRLFDDPWAVTPLVRAVLPSHDYNHRGEAVVGRDLREFQVGFGAARRLAGFLPRAFVQAGYTYAFVERVLASRTTGATATSSSGTPCPAASTFAPTRAGNGRTAGCNSVPPRGIRSFRRVT